MVALLPPLLSGCVYLAEVKTDPDEIDLSGMVWADPFDAESELSTGALGFHPLDDDVWRDEQGEELVDESGRPFGEAYQPDLEGSPGWWSVMLPPDQPFVVRVEGGEGSTTALLRGHAPSGSGYWYSGTIFAWDTARLGQVLDDSAGILGVTYSSLVDAEVAHLWGTIHSENWETFEPDRLTVYDGSGASLPVHFLQVQDDGAWRVAVEPPYHYLMAFDLAPGDTVLVYDGESGEHETVFPDVRPGDLVSPWYFLVD